MLNKKLQTLDFIPHPGLTLSEILESLDMSQVNLSKRISKPEAAISEIINGTKAITPETAIQLERALGVSASFWNNLETNYRELLARKSANDSLNNEFENARSYPYAEMAKKGWVKQTRKIEEKVSNLLNFFAVDSLSLVHDVIPVDFRQHNGKNISIHSIQAWLRRGEIKSKEIETKDFDKRKLIALLPKLKKLSTLHPNEFIPKLRDELANVGVAIIFTPYLPKSYVCGATRWINPKKALLQLSLRGSFADIMWFTLYHELGHIILHGKKAQFIDLDNINKKEVKEQEANKFASENIIPSEKFKKLKENNNLTTLDIFKFAKKEEIHPGIIVGKLQHDGLIDYSKLNNLRVKYKFSN